MIADRSLIMPFRAGTLLLALVASFAGGTKTAGRQSAGSEAPPQATSAGPRLYIDSPKDGAYISGQTPLAAHVLPASQRVERMTFFVDNRIACVLEAAPFQCEFNVGPGVNEHQVRVVAELPGAAGALRRTVRTQGSPYVEGVDVEAILVTTTVTDSSGRFVRDLPRSAFRVLEDGVPQAISSFTATNIPLEIVVAADMSGSMAEAMPQVRQAVKKFLTALRPQDRVTVLAFNDRIVTLARPTVDLATRLRNVDRLEAWGGTAFYETIVRALEIQGRQTGRRAVVLFTDGEDRNSLVPRAAAQRAVETSDSLLYLIGLGQGPRVPALREVMETFARVSGGRAFFADAADQLDERFSQIIEELSNQYLLGYQPRNDKQDGTWRKVQVLVSNPDYRVRAREGYRAVRAGAAR